MLKYQSKTTQEWVQLYLKEVGVKYAEEITIRPKNESKLLRALRPILELFNKHFWSEYITTIGTTIWYPDGWFERGDIKSRLQTVAHEVIHVKQAKKFTGPLFQFLYLFPQSLAVFSLLSFLAIGLGLNWLWCLLFLLCLAPIPAPFRYMFELEAYRVLLVFYKYAWHTSPGIVQMGKDRIIKNLAKSDYYFTWPFPKMIQKDLDKQDKIKKEQYSEQYSEIIAFLERNNLLADDQ